MGWAIDSAIEVFKKSLDWEKLWLPYFILAVISFAVSFSLMFATLGMQPLFGPLTNVGLLEGLIIYTIVSMLFGIFILGISLSIAMDYLKKKKFSLGRAMKRTKERFIVMLAVGVIFSAIFFILSFASFFLPGYYTPGYSLDKLLGLFVAMIMYLVVIFLAAPFLLVVAPVALFEKRGIFASLRRIIELGKKDYTATLGYVMMLFLFLMLAYIVFVVAMLVFILLAFVIVGIPLLIAAFAALMAWILAYYNLAMVKLYQVKVSVKC